MDLSGDWACMREIRGSGMFLVRPDRHVFWHADMIAADPVAAVRRVLTSILAR
jgi:2,4-dichlorophenol 6-monooxygenase